MLWQRMQTPCVHMVRSDAPDGIGGNTHTWTDGGGFEAAIVKNNSTEMKIAEQNGLREMYTVTTTEPLAYQDVIKRTADGMILRVTSRDTDSRPPEEATFDFRQVTAERWVLA